jgi:hypothetical protein
MKRRAFIADTHRHGRCTSVTGRAGWPAWLPSRATSRLIHADHHPTLRRRGKMAGSEFAGRVADRMLG